MTTRGYGDRWWEQDKPADLEKTNVASAEVASQTSKDSYTKKITLALVKNKKYTFWFTYYHQDTETKEIKESDRSPIWIESFTIPNLTKAVQNLTLTPGLKSYGVKFNIDPTSIQEDVVIFESLTGLFAGEEYIVYVGTSTNVTIQTSNYAPRWVRVRSRDKWDDLNITNVSAGPVTPLNSEVDTTVVPGAPTGVLVTAFNETSDPSNYTGYVNVSWTAPAAGAKGYNVGVWESTPGATLPSREFKVEGTSSKIDGLFVGKSYYVQVKSLSEFGTPSAWVPPALNYPVVIPGNTAVPGAVTISGVGTPRSIVLSWTVPASNANLVTSGGYYIAKLYSNSLGTGTPLQTKTCFSNSATFAGLTTGSSYWITIQAYTGGATPVAGDLSSVYGPLVPIAVEPPDIQADFILANNQFQVGGTSGANDVHLSAYPKTVGGLLTNGRIYIGGPETSGSAAVGLYNSNGTPFYADNLGRFSLGDKLTWSGNALNIIGTIDVTGASTFSSYIISGATNSAFIGIGKQVPYRVSSVLQSGVNGLTGIVINNSGAATNSDYIKSDGSFRLGDGGLTYNGSLLNLTGTIQASGGTFTGNLRVTTGSIIAGGTFAADGSVSGARVVMQTGGLYAHDATGAQSVFIQSADGLIDARKGYIGGWTINGTAQTTGTISSSNTKIESNGTITLGDTTGTLASIVRLSATDPFRIWVGSQSSSNAAFKVSSAGVLTATGAVITGNVQITSGGTYDSIVAAQQAATAANATAGTANSNATAALTTASGKNSIFRSASTPSALKEGDIWINWNDENKLYVATAAGTGSWVLSRDATIAAAVTKADSALAQAQAAVSTANAAYPASNFSKSAILQAINASANGTKLNGGVLETGTVLADNVVSTYVYAGYINADMINAGTITGRAINNGNGTFSVDSSGNLVANSGKIGGFNLTGVTDLEARTADRPRIIFGTKISLGWDDDYTYSNNYYGLRIGNSFTTTNARMVINTKDNVFRASIDTTRIARALEVSNTVRAVNLEYTTSLIGPTSSRRFKDNITYLPKTYYEKILDIKPAVFVYKNNEEVLEEIRGSHGLGLIAEDLEDAGLGYFVQRDMQGRPTQLMDAHELSYLLIPIVKDMKEEIAVLKTRIETLENL